MLPMSMASSLHLNNLPQILQTCPIITYCTPLHTDITQQFGEKNCSVNSNSTSFQPQPQLKIQHSILFKHYRNLNFSITIQTAFEKSFCNAMCQTQTQFCYKINSYTATDMPTLQYYCQYSKQPVSTFSDF